MSTTSSSVSGSDFSADESYSASDRAGLQCALTHVFLPFPFNNALMDDYWLIRPVCAVAHAYSKVIDDTLKPQWHCITKMLDSLKAFIWFWPGERGIEGDVVFQLHGMQTGDILAFLNDDQDTAVIFRKQDHRTLYESFQTSWDSDSTPAGSYPEWAVEIPNEVFHKQDFQSELADFLLRKDKIAMDYNNSEDGVTYTKLLTNILRGVGRSTEVPHITKRVGRSTEVPHITKRVHSHARSGLWQRSSLWLLIKVAIQTSLDHGGVGRVYYKSFMLHFMCYLAKHSINANLFSCLLHAISAKILRRLRKLGASSPDWLYDMVLKTNASLREILETRWKEVEAPRPLPSLWEPSQLDLDGDMQLSLLGSLKYIHDTLANVGSKPLGAFFCPKHLPCGTLNDFLSLNGMFFEEAYNVNPYVTLYDVEQAVEQGIDDWVVCIMDVDEACIQLEILMDKYLSGSLHRYQTSPEDISIKVLTVIELWIALDKLVVAVIPMLADYSPDIPTELLHGLLLRKTMNFHHLRHAYQYLSARHLSARHLSARHLSARHSQLLQSNSIFAAVIVCEGRRVSSQIWRSATARLLGALPYLAPTEFYKWEGYPFSIKHCTSPDHPTVPDKHFVYWDPYLSSHALHQYTNATSHTSNEVLAAQAKCPDDFPPSEFIAFGHLRSGGSLQWLNILRELCSRTLNFRRHEVYLLIAQAVSQVGPLDLNTTEWVWHQELQESSFCSTLLDELESLLVDVGVYSLNGIMMGTISFLLTRLLASCCYEDILERAIRLLWQVHTKTFEWVQELSYDLMMASTDRI